VADCMHPVPHGFPRLQPLKVGSRPRWAHHPWIHRLSVIRYGYVATNTAGDCWAFPAFPPPYPFGTGASQPIPMRVGAGQPHKAEWWLKFDTLSHKALTLFWPALTL